ncbi:MAG: thioredoxin [Hymenobacter sp.]
MLCPDAATLLVLLPDEEPGRRAATEAWLRGFRARLGPAIRVLKLDETGHAAVVRSFGAPALPACILLRHGVELRQQSGLPEEELLAALLLRKVTEGNAGG